MQIKYKGWSIPPFFLENGRGQMESIQQTNRTMLFEMINPEKLDLMTLIGNIEGIESLDDQKIQEIHEALVVHSFDQFLEKFVPTVYGFFEVNTQKVMYTLKKPHTIPEEMLLVVPLDKDNDFLRMLIKLIDSRQEGKRLDNTLNLENIIDMLSPKKVMQEMRELRGKLRYVYDQRNRADADSLAYKKWAREVEKYLVASRRHYNHIMAMLPVVIEDTRSRLFYEKEKERAHMELIWGVLDKQAGGQVKIVEAPDLEDVTLSVIDEEVNTAFIEFIKEDYRAHSQLPNAYTEELLVRTFYPLSCTKSFDIEKEVKHYNTYLTFYQNSKESFIKTTQPLVQKILGIKSFFDQYGDTHPKMQPKLLITNIENNTLAKHGYMTRLSAYLNTVNTKNNFSHTIWFAIVPNIELENEPITELTRQRFKGNDQLEQKEVTTLESMTQILATISQYKVQAFFSFQASEKNTFKAIKTKGIDRFVDRCYSLEKQPYSAYAIPCLPNFTVIPKERSGIVIGKKVIVADDNTVKYDSEKRGTCTLWVGGVYIDAAYVAAGLVAAYQCPSYLKKAFRKKVDMRLPGVRYDIEQADRNLITKTSLAKETTGYTAEAKRTIEANRFGFVFSSENKILGDQNINHIMVYQARSMASTNRRYEPIYQTLVCNYIERILRYETTDFKKDRVERFFSNHPTSRKTQWMEQKDYINSIIAEDDNLNVTIVQEHHYCIVGVDFNGEVKNLQIEMNRR